MELTEGQNAALAATTLGFAWTSRAEVCATRLTEPKCGLVDCRPIVLGPPRIER